MILKLALIALLLQSATASQQTTGRASIAGVVLNGSTGEPLANVRVSLGRTDISLGAFEQMVAGDRPPGDIVIPAEILTALAEEARSSAEAGGRGASSREAAALSALPVKEIHELVVGASGAMAVVPRSSLPILTDERGRFAFNNVEPGTYRVMFNGTGFARQDYGQRSASGIGVPIKLAAGQSKTDFVMRMMAVGAIGGRLRDETGQPAAAVPVQLVRSVYDENGRVNLERVASTRTDDRGEYRMFYLSPGRYYLRAGNEGGRQLQITGLGSLEYTTNNRIAQNYAMIYYPGTASQSAATPIDVQPGQEALGLDFVLGNQQVFRVRGRLVDPRSGQPPASASISVAFQSRDPLVSTSIGTSSSYKADDGSFLLQDLSPGTYVITANLPNPTPQRQQPNLEAMSPADRTAYFEAQTREQLNRPKAWALVDVVNSDIEGLVLTVGTGSSIPARLRFESSPNAGIPMEFVRVQLRTADFFSRNSSDTTPQSSALGTDGTFRIDNVWPGEHRLSVIGLPSGYYVKEARLGSTDLLNGPLRYAGPQPDTLEILIGSTAAAIDGTVLDAAGQLMAGAEVVLIPSRNRERTELFRPVTADSNGRFNVTSVAPGDYTIAAWDGIEPFSFFDPQRIAEAERLGKAVRVAESGAQTVSVTAITETR